MNRKVYLLALTLGFLAVTLMAAKIYIGGQNVKPEFGYHLWRINIAIRLSGKGERAKIRLTLPQDNVHQTIYNENFENDGLDFYVRQRELTRNRVGFWRSQMLAGSKTIQYTFSAQLKGAVYNLPLNQTLPKNPLEAYLPEFHPWLDASKFIQSEDAAVKQQLKKMLGREKNVSIVLRRIFDFVRGEVKYKSERGSKDATQTLKKLVADCGGQARLFAALARAAGIPTRIVGGIIMSPGIKLITHVWTESYVGDKWIPFDVVNNNFAGMPKNYLELYRGDYALFKHVGLSKFEYFFLINRERIPPIDYPWSLYVLPPHLHNLVKILLLIPVGALIVAFTRVVVGLPTFGTFSPILLALAFREVSLWVGLYCLIIILGVGWALRSLLDHLKILVIPRLSIVVTMVVLSILMIMIVGLRIGQPRLLYVSLFPMVIITWTIERFAIIQIEDGTAAALKTTASTVLVAIAAYYVMGYQPLKAYLFAFPELLFGILALLLLLGRYTGIRLTEFWRFRNFQMGPKKGGHDAA